MEKSELLVYRRWKMSRLPVRAAMWPGCLPFESRVLGLIPDSRRNLQNSRFEDKIPSISREL